MAETSSKSEYVVGVDIGGTKIYSGVFNSSLECIGTARVSTKADRGPDAVIERILRCVLDAVDDLAVSGEIGEHTAVGDARFDVEVGKRSAKRVAGRLVQSLAPFARAGADRNGTRIAM